MMRRFFRNPTIADTPDHPAVDERVSHPLQATSARQRHVGRELTGLVVITLGVVLALSLFSYNPDELASGTSSNLMGPFGTHTADLLLHLFGAAAFLLAGLITLLGVLQFSGRQMDLKPSEIVGQLFVIAGGAVLAHLWWRGEMFLSHMPGGAVGALVGEMTRAIFGHLGSYLVSFALTLTGFILALDASFTDAWRTLRRLITLPQRTPQIDDQSPLEMAPSITDPEALPEALATPEHLAPADPHDDGLPPLSYAPARRVYTPGAAFDDEALSADVDTPIDHDTTLQAHTDLSEEIDPDIEERSTKDVALGRLNDVVDSIKRLPNQARELIHQQVQRHAPRLARSSAILTAVRPAAPAPALASPPLPGADEHTPNVEGPFDESRADATHRKVASILARASAHQHARRHDPVHADTQGAGDAITPVEPPTHRPTAPSPRVLAGWCPTPLSGQQERGYPGLKPRLKPRNGPYAAASRRPAALRSLTSTLDEPQYCDQ